MAAPSPMITVPFSDRVIHLPQYLTSNENRPPSLLVQIGAGNKHLTGSTLEGFETHSVAYHLEYEIRRQSDYDQASQLYTAAMPHLSEAIFAITADTVQADIFNLLIRSVPIDLIEFVEIESGNGVYQSREIVSFSNCIITHARRYNASWGAEARNNILLVAFRASQWSVHVNARDQGSRPMGTGAVEYLFETSAAA